MIRVVIDTNILVSALLQPESVPAAVFMPALSGEVQLCVSEAVFAEYDEVIRRPHLKRGPDVIEGALQSIRRLGHWSSRLFELRNAPTPTITSFWNVPKLPTRIIW
jgi:uncharacterized protein